MNTNSHASKIHTEREGERERGRERQRGKKRDTHWTGGNMKIKRIQIKFTFNI